jgi:hypothetical protein
VIGTPSPNGNDRASDRPPEAACGHGAKLERRQHAAIAALLAESTVGKAAARAKVGERTLRRWMTESPAFRAGYAAARSAALDGAVKQLQVASTQAVRVLQRIARNKLAQDAARVSAARAINTTALKATELTTVMERLEALERAALTNGHTNGRYRR